MATQYKKLQNKLMPKQPRRKPAEGVGKDLLLIAMMGFLFFVLVVTWFQTDLPTKAMYMSLLASFVIIYTRKNNKIPEKYVSLADKACLFFTAFGIVLFVVVCINTFLA